MSIETFLAEARAELARVEPHEAARLQAEGALLADIRPRHNREAEGEIPGSVPIERIVLEWRLDPRSEHRIPGITEETTVVVLCNEGYASSLAARDLRRLGLPGATDLVGGFRAWAAAGLPVREGATPAIT
ncbi:sulfurtransferase [Prauserella sp. PE36]|uniref:Rhodanese-like domain-containing protein n=1 Tax=Prauserella endophytica TaxID=1592324 RepID=A0ABY2S5E3_9PSEU|nr:MULTISPECIES: rhodanese-like domain-containing protein [Prauserella]PXY30007.1 sulfurtransferase [Prauserella coralliicola]RBM12542.1 sulfurtransferase [Prauserella sp. PE36]TKG71067.1 rhodanese-like domain-containing protein [Prauserella endophytica]